MRAEGAKSAEIVTVGPAPCFGPVLDHGSGASGRDDQLPGCASGLHRGVSLDDLLEAVHMVNRYDDVAGGDGVQEFLQNRLEQVLGLAVVGRQAYSSGQVVNRVEVTDCPDIGQHPGEAHDPVLPSRVQGVRQGRRTNKFQSGVGPAWEDLAHLPGNIAVIDQDVVDADPGQGCGLVCAARRREHGHSPLFGENCRRHAHRRRAASDEDRLPG